MEANTQQIFTHIQGMTVDMSAWPIVVFTSTDDMTDEAMEKFLRFYEETIMSKEERFAAVLDLRQSGNTPSRQRKILTDRMNKNKEFKKQYCVGTAMVFDSPVIRSVLIAILWLFSPEHKTQVFKTYEEALEWAQSRF